MDTYVAGLQAGSTQLVRGSSRRITTMRFRPANIRVINRRDSFLGRFLRCFLRTKRKDLRKEGRTWSVSVYSISGFRRWHRN